MYNISYKNQPQQGSVLSINKLAVFLNILSAPVHPPLQQPGRNERQKKSPLK